MPSGGYISTKCLWCPEYGEIDPIKAVYTGGMGYWVILLALATLVSVPPSFVCIHTHLISLLFQEFGPPVPNGRTSCFSLQYSPHFLTHKLVL
jgi:hypothetical protein